MDPSVERYSSVEHIVFQCRWLMKLSSCLSLSFGWAWAWARLVLLRPLLWLPVDWVLLKIGFSRWLLRWKMYRLSSNIPYHCSANSLSCLASPLFNGCSPHPLPTSIHQQHVIKCYQMNIFRFSTNSFLIRFLFGLFWETDENPRNNKTNKCDSQR